MRNGFKLASIAGAMMMLSSGANAALPTGAFDSLYDETQANNVKMPTFCAGFGGSTNCEVIASGTGFLQVMVGGTGQIAGAAPGEEVYIMTYVGEQGFSDHSYVRMSTANSDTQTDPGIAAIQTIQEADLVRGGGFESTTTIASGTWAKTSADVPDVSISQNLVDLGGGTDAGTGLPTPGSTMTNDGNNFFASFDFESNSGQNTGYKLDLGQVAGLLGTGGSVDDKQTFVYRARSGSYTAGGSGTLASANDVNWAAGDEVKAVWMGQSILLPDVAGTGNDVQSDFGYMAFQNTSAGADIISDSGFTGTEASGPWNNFWSGNVASEFGTAPCLADPSGATC
jgi:hypothetical protein